MREYIFHGKRVYDGEWIEGCLIHQGDHYLILQDESKLHPMDVPYIDDFGCIDGRADPVVPESVGQYTWMKEFVVTDRSFNKSLFEGDIVEVWSRRRPPTENICLYRDKPTSQYDIEVKARAVIRFKYGEWFLDYDNEYNNTLCKLRGNEQCERTVAASHRLYNFGFHNSNEDWHREHNARCKWDDIVNIGTVFDNADLLEG